jgi:hypothetical protein
MEYCGEIIIQRPICIFIEVWYPVHAPMMCSRKARDGCINYSVIFKVATLVPKACIFSSFQHIPRIFVVFDVIVINFITGKSDIIHMLEPLLNLISPVGEARCM